jgi:hypothetical protein
MECYEQLLALVEREHALVVGGSWEALAAVDALRRELVARLPAEAPASCADLLARAADVQAQTTALLAFGVDELRRELGALSQGRTAVRGYAGAGAVATPAVGTRLDLAG